MLDSFSEVIENLRSLSWGAWVAAMAFVTGLGTFLDDYYVGDNVRSRVRSWTASKLVATLSESAFKRHDWREFGRGFLQLLAYALMPVGVYYLLKYLPLYPPVKPEDGWLGILKFAANMTWMFFMWYGMMLAPFGIGITLVLIVLMAVLSYQALHSALVAVLRPAASPTKSPFKFASAMIGLWILLAKVCLEITKP